MDKRSVTAWLLECKPGDLMGYTDFGDHVVALNPAGQKFIFDNAQLAKAEKTMACAPAQEQVKAMTSTKANKATKIRKSFLRTGLQGMAQNGVLEHEHSCTNQRSS